jgi:hypothetical protein
MDSGLGYAFQLFLYWQERIRVLYLHTVDGFYWQLFLSMNVTFQINAFQHAHNPIIVLLLCVCANVRSSPAYGSFKSLERDMKLYFMGSKWIYFSPERFCIPLSIDFTSYCFQCYRKQLTIAATFHGCKFH